MFNLRNAAVWFALLVMSEGTGCAETNSNSAGARLMDVEVGMTQNQVVSILGEPERRETYGGTEFLIYPASSSSPQNFMPIAVVGGRVTGIGRNVYDNVVRSKTQSDLVARKSN
jgi:SmpA/OmlA family protein